MNPKISSRKIWSAQLFLTMKGIGDKTKRRNKPTHQQVGLKFANDKKHAAVPEQRSPSADHPLSGFDRQPGFMTLKTEFGYTSKLTLRK
jgi:hypothetical protein